MQRRRLLTFLTGSVAGIGVTLAAIPFFRFMGKPEYLKPPLYHQLIKFPRLQPGQMMTAPGSGDTLYIVRRAQSQISALKKANATLLDPDSVNSEQPDFAKNSLRSINPEYFIASGMCAHLGCGTSHISTDGDGSLDVMPEGGFLCPCHGAMFDSAGRVYKGGPTELNLFIPEYEFVDATTIRLTDENKSF